MRKTGRGKRSFFSAGAVKGAVSAVLAAAAVTSMSAISAFAADHDIIVIHTNDVHCGVEENIGYGGLSLYKEEMEEESPYVFLVDAGDSIQGAPIGTLSDGGYLISIMNEIGYDFAVPGNHEFDYGMERFLELAGKLDCGYYSCNFMDLAAGKPKLKPYKIVECGDEKLAFVGVCTPESFTKSTPAYFQDGSGKYLYGFCEDDTGEALYWQVQESVDSAKAEGADYVIMVGHLGKDGVTEKWSAEAIVKNTNGIDAVIDGHSHQAYTGVFENKDGDKVPAAQTGTKLEHIGTLTIATDGSIRTELVDQVPAAEAVEVVVKRGDTLSRLAKRYLGSWNAWPRIYEANRTVLKNPDLLPVGTSLTVARSAASEDGRNTDPKMDAYLAKIETEYQEALKTVLGHTEVELTDSDPDTGERVVRSGETNLGDLCADAYRACLETDVGLMNGGGIRAGVRAGSITYEDMLSVYPYGNMICAVKVTGQQLKDALEMGARNLPEESGGFLQVSGLTYTVDTSIPSGVQTDDKGNFQAVAGEYRVRDVMVGGKALVPDQVYTVASHNYMLKNGGDGYSMFLGAEVVKDDVMVDVDTLSAYIRDELGGSVGDDYKNPKGQGRIQIWGCS